jgi:hypothetical protein
MTRSTALACATSFAVALTFTTAVAAQPRLVVPEPAKDFGDVTTGTLLEHRFELRNEGDAPLTLQELRPGMGIKIRSFDATIPAGGSGAVEVELDSLRLSGEGRTVVGLLTDDPAHSTFVLEVAFRVTPALLGKPGFARWNYVQGETTGTIGNLLWARDGGAFTVLDVETPMPAIRVTFRPATDSERNPTATGSQWRVELTLEAEAPVGAVEGIALVHTDHPLQQRVAIPLSGFVRPRYLLEPPRGQLGELQLAAPQTIRYSLRNFATAPVEVLGAETTIPGVSVAVQAEQPGRRYHVDVTLDPAAMKSGDFAGRLVVKLSDPLQPTVELALSGELQRPTSR